MTSRDPISGQCVLVTGGAGFIGSHLVDRLLSEGAREVVVIDNLFVGAEENLAAARGTGRVVFYRDDAELTTSLDYIFEMHDVGTVFNCATKALNYSFHNPSNAFSTNVTVALNLLELQRRGKFHTLCHFSTSEVYGTAVYEPMDEEHPRSPTTTYAAGKAAADLAVESYVRMFDVDAYIVRPFNNYGPRQNHNGLLAGIIPITAKRVLTGGKPEIHGDGQQSRDFIYVSDTVDAVLKLHERLPAGETVNISTDNQITIKELVDRISKELGYDGEILRRPARPSDVLCHNASNAKVRQLIDYTLTPFEAGLSRTLDYYRDLARKEQWA
ncbi:dTDP-glucose 4,6-dehydratase [Allosphingosinicella vermicomposti]|uniref:dTDP-glucose 4,6-dehydratase n=1 Tax=Allosphingosinicella vermicomposti TaxID=614671 RepID=UPI000D10859A|nr:NAD-dependent epimerase/dehydratase family protein [Allosphingosinicella vermicomposti]